MSDAITTGMWWERAKQLLKRREGLRNSRYQDTLGHWTIGYGHKLRDGESMTWISDEDAEQLLDEDMNRVLTQIMWSWADWFKELPESAKVALVCWVYQLGFAKVSQGFPNSVYRMRQHRWNSLIEASHHWLWDRQTPARTTDFRRLIRLAAKEEEEDEDAG